MAGTTLEVLDNGALSGENAPPIDSVSRSIDRACNNLWLRSSAG